MEKGGERWSKPHVATLSLHSLMELKMCIEKGIIMLDLEATTLPQVVGEWTRTFFFPLTPGGSPERLPPSFPPTETIIDSHVESGQLKADLKEKVMYTLLRKHRHQTKKSNLRSLADIGKSVSSASRLFSNQENGNVSRYTHFSVQPVHLHSDYFCHGFLPLTSAVNSLTGKKKLLLSSPPSFSSLFLYFSFSLGL